MSLLRRLLTELKRLVSALAGASIRGLLSLISALLRTVKKRPHSTNDSQTIRIVYPLPNDLHDNVTSFSLLPAALNTHAHPYRHCGPSASRSSQDVSAALPTQERYSLHSLSVSHLPATNQHPPAAASVQDLSSRPPSPGLALGGYMPSTNPSVVDITVDPPETESPVESPQSSRVFGDVVASTALINEHYPLIFPGIPDTVRRYERKVSVPDEPTQYAIPSLTIRMDPVPSPQGWTVCQHPEGAQYFFHKEKRVFTDANLYDSATHQFMSTQINTILDFLRAHNVVLQSNVDLVVDEYECQDGSKGVQYYFANHQDRCVFWMDKTDADLFPITYEVNGITSASHIRHILEAQYWYHCELFPCSLQVTETMVDELRDLVLHAMGDLVTSTTSTVSWKTEDLNTILTLVDGFAKNVGRNADNRFNGTSCLVGRFMFLFANSRVYNFHGEPGARLDIDASVYGKPRERTRLMSLLSPLLFYAPDFHLSGLQSISCDGLVRQHSWQKFITRLNSEWQEFTLLATVVLNSNVGFLSIQSVDQGGQVTPWRSPAQIASYLSILTSIGSIICGLLLMKQNRDRDRMSPHVAATFIADRTHPFLGLEMLATMHALPYAMLIWSMVSFLAAFSFMCFQNSDLVTRTIVAVFWGAVAGLILWCALSAWENIDWDWLRQLFSFSFKQEQADDVQDEKSVAGSQKKRRRWTWPLRLRKGSVDSERTVVANYHSVATFLHVCIYRCIAFVLIITLKKIFTLATRASTNAFALLRNATVTSEGVVVRRRRNPNPTRASLSLTNDLRQFCRRCFSTFPSPEEQQDIFLANIGPSRRAAFTPEAPAAEREWLQSAFHPSPGSEASQSSPRFDWRLRAPSRVKSKPAGKRSKYVRREYPSRINVGLNEPYYDAIQSYSKRFMAMLEAEQQEDEAVLKERLSTWSLTRLQEEGYCLTGLSSYWLEETQFGRPVASFLQGPGITLPEHRFENGTQILLSRLDPLKQSFAQGSVVSRSATQIRIAFREHFEGLDEGVWRIDVGRSNIVYERMRDAIAHFNHNPQQLEEAAMSADRELILQGTHLRDVLLRSSQPSAEDAPDKLETDGAFKDDQRIYSWATRYSQPVPLVMEGDPPLSRLNPTQIRAMAMMIGQRISLIQGPPGTGKTKTIIETIKLLKVHFEVPHPLLVCTYTNVAVDNLVEGLAAAGVRPLRVGFGGQVKDTLVEHTLDHKLAQHPLKPSLDAVMKQEEEAQQFIAKLTEKLESMRESKPGKTANAQERTRQIILNMESDLALRQRILGSLKARMYALQMEMLRDVVSAADVICTTCITSASSALNVVDFPVVFLDEASMSTEPASLIPIMKGSRHLALIGDHKQLPPVITSPEAEALGLGRSLFERLTEEGVVPSIMLDTQYRMHPGISLFPSSEFYNFSLQDGTVDAQGNISPLLTPPSSAHLKEDEQGRRPSVIFLDHAGGESLKDKSRINRNEAAIVMAVVEDLLLNNPKLMGRDIGIIAPYVAQITHLTRLLTTDAKYAKRFKEVLGEHRAMQLPHIEVKTVDGFEGREKEVIVFSTVRNNAGGYIGFLADRRRLNVGLTRAKRGLFVVGSISTLGKGLRAVPKAKEAQPLLVPPGEIAVIKAKETKKTRSGGKGKGRDSWKRYAEWLMDRGLVVHLTGDSLGQALYGNLKRTGKDKAQIILKQ